MQRILCELRCCCYVQWVSLLHDCVSVVQVMSSEWNEKERYCENTKIFSTSTCCSFFVGCPVCAAQLESFFSIVWIKIYMYFWSWAMMHVKSLKVVNSLELVNDYWFIIQHPMKRFFSELFLFVVVRLFPLPCQHSKRKQVTWNTERLTHIHSHHWQWLIAFFLSLPPSLSTAATTMIRG